MLHVEEINDIERLTGYRTLWDALLSRTPGASFFHTLDWLETYWRHFGQGQRLRALVVCSAGQPVGILPLVVRTEDTRVGPVRVLTYPLHDWGTFFGPIGPNPTATLSAGLRHIGQTRRDWDMLDLRWVDAEGGDRGRTERAMEQAGLRPHKQAWDQAAVIEFQGTWQDYWCGRDKKFRHNVERCGRRLAEQGAVSLIRYRPADAVQRDGEPRWDLYDACVALAERSWQGSSTDGTTLSHGDVASYLRDAHEAAARRGMLDLNLLCLNGRPVAFVYNYHYDGRVSGLRKGFDPALAALRPGLVLQHMMLEDGFRRGDRSYDLGAGYLDSKRQWQTQLATSHRFTHFPAAVSRAQLLRLKRWWVQRRYGDQYVACVRGPQIADLKSQI